MFSEIAGFFGWISLAIESAWEPVTLKPACLSSFCRLKPATHAAFALWSCKNKFWVKSIH